MYIPRRPGMFDGDDADDSDEFGAMPGSRHMI
jgi:hypothetical protein